MSAFVEPGNGAFLGDWIFYVFYLMVLYQFGRVAIAKFLIWSIPELGFVCDPVLAPTEQPNNLTAEPPTSHTGMPEGHTPDNRDQPSPLRADTHARVVHYERVPVRCSRGRYTKERVLVQIDL